MVKLESFILYVFLTRVPTHFQYEIHWVVYYRLYKLKNMKNNNAKTHVKHTKKPRPLLKVILFHGCLSRFLNCTNGTKRCQAFIIYYIPWCTYITYYHIHMTYITYFRDIKRKNSPEIGWRCCLRLSWRRSLLYRNQCTDLRSKSLDWFLYSKDICHERVNKV